MIIKRGETWHLRLMYQGRLYQKSLKTSNKNTALNLEATFRTNLVKGEFGVTDAAQSPTLSEFETRLFKHLKSNVAPRTYEFYQFFFSVLTDFSPLAKSKLTQIDPALIEDFVQHRLKDEVAVITVNHSLRTLRRALHLAKEWKLIRDVPTVKLLPGENQRETVLTEHNIEQLTDYLNIAYPDSMMQWLFPFLVDTGLRVTEACNLMREHVHLNVPRPFIHVAKGKSKYAKRDVPLTHRATTAIESALEKSRCEYAFTAKGGRKPLSRFWPSEMFRTLKNAAGLPDEAVLHSTRHTFCTRLGEAGADAFTIQKLAGHSSILISQRYVHADRALKESAISLLDEMQKEEIPDPFRDVPDTEVHQI